MRTAELIFIICRHIGQIGSRYRPHKFTSTRFILILKKGSNIGYSVPTGCFSSMSEHKNRTQNVITIRPITFDYLKDLQLDSLTDLQVNQIGQTKCISYFWQW